MEVKLCHKFLSQIIPSDGLYRILRSSIPLELKIDFTMTDILLRLIMPKIKTVFLLLTLTFLNLVGAQDKYPNRSIQLVTPLFPGTTLDFVARTFADRLTQVLKQSVIVLNKPGAGGTIAEQTVAKSVPDGYTLLIINSQHTFNPALYTTLPYDTLADFAGIAQIGDAPSVMVVPPKLGITTLKEFISLAKQNPGKLNYSSAGIGTTTHIGPAYLFSKADIDLVHVPYKGNEMLTDMLSGHIDAIVTPIAFVLQHIREGKVIAIAVTSRETLQPLPGVPTVEQAGGIADFQYSTYYGFVAPIKTPRTIINQLSAAIKQVTFEKEIKEKFSSQAIFPTYLGPTEFDAYIKADLERIGPFIKKIGATAN